MNYEQLEASIVARLSPLNLIGVECIPLPEIDVDVLLPSTKGKVTVAYLKSKFDLSVDTHIVAQPETISFQLVIQSRKLRGSIGIYNILKSVKSLLLGWKSDVTGKIHFDESGIVDHESSIWTYRLNLTTQNLAIEEPDDVVTVIATHITFIDEYFNTIEITGDMADELNEGVTTWNGPVKKYWRSEITEGVELTDVVENGFKLLDFAVRNDSANDVTLRLGTTPGGNDVVGMDMLVPAMSVNTATINIQYSDTENKTLFLSSPDWNNSSVTILLTSMEGIV